MFKGISTALLLMFAMDCYAAPPWYTIYKEYAKLNDSQLWQEHVEGLMEQYQSNIDDNSYQSEAGSISQGLKKIENSRVVEIIWKYYSSNGKYKNAASLACLAIGSKNPEMRKNLLLEFADSKDFDFKTVRAIEMLSWEAFPELALTFLFDSFNELSEVNRTKFLSNLRGSMVHRKEPVGHFRLIQGRVLARLVDAKSPEEVKLLVGILAQLERWSRDGYLHLANVIEQGQIANETLVTILRALSYEVNGVIGATFENLTPTSVSLFFKVFLTAKESSAPEVRAAVVEASFWQVNKNEFPQELKDWILGIKADPLVYSRVVSAYKGLNVSMQSFVSDSFPGLFPRPSAGGILKNLSVLCGNAFSRWFP